MFLFFKGLDSARDLLSLGFPTEGKVFAFLTSISRAVYSAHSTIVILLYHYLINTENYASNCCTVLSSLLPLPPSKVPIQSSFPKVRQAKYL